LSMPTLRRWMSRSVSAGNGAHAGGDLRGLADQQRAPLFASKSAVRSYWPPGGLGWRSCRPPPTARGGGEVPGGATGPLLAAALCFCQLVSPAGPRAASRISRSSGFPRVSRSCHNRGRLRVSIGAGAASTQRVQCQQPTKLPVPQAGFLWTPARSSRRPLNCRRGEHEGPTP
jgi:hypothetical protein